MTTNGDKGVLDKVIGPLIVAGIVAVVALLWNLDKKFTEFTVKAAYTRGIVCQMAHKMDIADVECL